MTEGLLEVSALLKVLSRSLRTNLLTFSGCWGKSLLIYLKARSVQAEGDLFPKVVSSGFKVMVFHTLNIFYF